MTQREGKTAVITGASRGIGAATARRLADEGFDVVLGARRLEEIVKIAADTGGIAHSLDVTDMESVDSFVAELDRVDILINNAGLALGRDSIEELSEEDVRTMWETNVYEGVTPLTADDIADAVAWVVTRPSHVNIDEMVFEPRDQASPFHIARRSKD